MKIEDNDHILTDKIFRKFPIKQMIVYRLTNHILRFKQDLMVNLLTQPPKIRILNKSTNVIAYLSFEVVSMVFNRWKLT